MHTILKNRDFYYLMLLISLLLGLPFCIMAYDRHLEPKKMAADTKEFTLTGNAQKGWILDEFQTHAVNPFWEKSGLVRQPVMEVSKGDMVMLKLRSSDITHGFRLDGYPIELIARKGITFQRNIWEQTSGSQKTDWNRVSTVKFVTHKPGKFIFRCTETCATFTPL